MPGSGDTVRSDPFIFVTRPCSHDPALFPLRPVHCPGPGPGRHRPARCSTGGGTEAGVTGGLRTGGHRRGASGVLRHAVWSYAGRDPGLQYVIPSVMGFFKSIALSSGNSLQDTLRLLTLWFKFGHRADVSVALSDGFSSVSIDTWLQVIPQLIARIHAPSPNVHRLIHQLLADIGKEHPQALVYSLTVASKSPSVLRKNAALAIMEKMRLHSPVLVEQALLVSQELIRVAILWHEMWHEGLEEASRLYFGDRNINGMLAQLEPLHMMLQRVSCWLCIFVLRAVFIAGLHESLY